MNFTSLYLHLCLSGGVQQPVSKLSDANDDTDCNSAAVLCIFGRCLVAPPRLCQVPDFDFCLATAEPEAWAHGRTACWYVCL